MKHRVPKPVPQRELPGERYKVAGTDKVVFLPDTMLSSGGPKSFTLGRWEFQIDHKTRQVKGAFPESWLIDLNA